MSRIIPDELDEHALAEAVSLFGLDANSVRLIGFSQNYVYTAQGPQGKRIVRISIGRHQSYKQIESELKWVCWLGKRGFNVALPVRSRNSRFCEQLDYRATSYLVTVFHHVPGRKPDHKDLSESFCERVGQIIGQMQRAWTEANGLHIDRNGWRESRLLNEDLVTSIAPISQGFRSSLQQLQDEVDSAVKDEQSYGLIHGDVTIGNIHIDHDRLWIFDFDNCEFGYFIQDLATFLYDGIYCKLVNRTPADSLTEEVRIRWNALIRGYREYGPLKEISSNTLRCFFLIRHAIIYMYYYRVLSEEVLLKEREALDRMKQDVETKSHRLDFDKIVSI